MANDLVGHLSAWIVTIAIHSTLLVGLGSLVAAQCRYRRAVSQEELVWRLALAGAPVTATVQALLASAWLGGSDARQAVMITLPGVTGVVTSAASGVPGRWWTMTILAVLGAATLLRFGHWSIQHLRLRSLLNLRQPCPPGMRSTLDELVRTSGSTVNPRLSVIAGLSSPVAFGIVRPEIAVPPRAVSEGPEAVRPMLAHELAHLRDRDPLWRALLDFMEVLFPWQILLRPVRKRLEVISDLRCDSRAAQWTGARPTARSLVTAAGWLPSSGAVPAYGLEALAGTRSLDERVDRLLAGSHEWKKPGLRFVTLLLVSLATLGPVLPSMAAHGAEERCVSSSVLRELPLPPESDSAPARITQTVPTRAAHECASSGRHGAHRERCAGGGHQDSHVTREEG